MHCSWYSVMKANWIHMEKLEKGKVMEIKMYKEIERREKEESITEKWKEEIGNKEDEREKEESKTKVSEVSERWKEQVKQK